jgi:hypothetical protein
MSNNIKIFKISEINFNNLHYTCVNVNCEKNIKIINVLYNYNNKKIPFLVEIDDLYMMDDIITVKNNDIQYYELILPLAGRTSTSTNQIKHFFEMLDNKIIEDAKQHKVLWKLDNGIKYKKIIKGIEFDNSNNIFVKNNIQDNFVYGNNLVKFKLVDTPNFHTTIFDKNRDIVNVNDYNNKVTGGQYIRSIIEVVAIWAKEDVFGLYIRPHQFKISTGSPPVINLQTYSFSDNNDNENYADNHNLISDTEVFINEKNLHNDTHNKHMSLETQFSESDDNSSL